MGSINHSESRSSQTFSRRGQGAIEQGSKRITWDIISGMWHSQCNPSGYLSVDMAENTLLHDTVLEYINANVHLSAEHLTYNNGSMGSHAPRKAVAHFLNRHFNPLRPVEPRHILMENGCSSAVEHLSWIFLNPGEAVLLGKPYYSTFIADISLRPEAVVVSVEVGDIDPLAKRQSKSMKKRPSNSKHALGTDDEIYALSVWNNSVGKDVPFTPFESILSRHTANLIDPDLVHVLWGMSKDFGANSLRVGAIISQSNPELHIAQKSLSLYSFVSAMSDQITAFILQNDDFTDKYIAQNQERLSQSHEDLVKLVNKHGIEYSHECNAGFFLWINLGMKYLESHSIKDGILGPELTDMIYQELLDNKVYLTHGAAYGSEIPGWFRVVFAHPRPWLEEAMARIMRAIR